MRTAPKVNRTLIALLRQGHPAGREEQGKMPFSAAPFDEVADNKELLYVN